jgi:hypothetical protein
MNPISSAPRKSTGGLAMSPAVPGFIPGAPGSVEILQVGQVRVGLPPDLGKPAAYGAGAGLISDGVFRPGESDQAAARFGRTESACSKTGTASRARPAASSAVPSCSSTSSAWGRDMDRLRATAASAWSGSNAATDRGRIAAGPDDQRLQQRRDARGDGPPACRWRRTPVPPPASRSCVPRGRESRPPRADTPTRFAHAAGSRFSEASRQSIATDVRGPGVPAAGLRAVPEGELLQRVDDVDPPAGRRAPASSVRTRAVSTSAAPLPSDPAGDTRTAAS